MTTMMIFDDDDRPDPHCQNHPVGDHPCPPSCLARIAATVARETQPYRLPVSGQVQPPVRGWLWRWWNERREERR